MSEVDASRRDFLCLGGLLRRVRERFAEPAADGTPFVGPEPPPPWARPREPDEPLAGVFSWVDTGDG